MLAVCSTIHCLVTEPLINRDISEKYNKRFTRLINSPMKKINTAHREAHDAHVRIKRALVFRPLFVYRQEKIERQRIARRKYQSRDFNRKNDYTTPKPYYDQFGNIYYRAPLQ